MSLHVLKFGGTSVGSIQSIERSVEITQNTSCKNGVVVVVSAISGITNTLEQLINKAVAMENTSLCSELDSLKLRHYEMVCHFAKNNSEQIWENTFAPLLEKLADMFRGISYLGNAPDNIRAYICSFGERLSSRIFQLALEHAGVMSSQHDSEGLVITDDNYLSASVDCSSTKKRVRSMILPQVKNGVIPVITGFFGGTPQGIVTLLGRGGSDYTASLLAVALGADSIEIWTDVNGIYSADPRYVEDAHLCADVDFYVAAELTSGGAKVLHPKTIAPAIRHEIPVSIRNSFHPKQSGTRIGNFRGNALLGITLDTVQTLIQVTTPKMLDEPGFLQQSSNFFAQMGIPIDMCVTSEVSVTYSIRKQNVPDDLIRSLKQICEVKVMRDVAKISIVGQGTMNNPSLLKDIFSVLQDEHIYSVSLGASFHNLTLMVDRERAQEILKNIHSCIFTY